MPFHQAFSSIYSYSWKEYWKAIKIILIFIVPHIILNANHSGFEHYYKLLGFCFLIIYSVYFSKLPPFFLMLILSHLWPVRTTSYWLLCLFDTAPLAFDSVFAFFFLVYLFIYLFIFGCVGSSFLCEGFLQLWRAGATLHRGARASHCCGAQAPDTQAQQLWLTGPVAPCHVGSSQTRARTCFPCIGRQILNHCATREAPVSLLFDTTCLKLIWYLPVPVLESAISLSEK